MRSFGFTKLDIALKIAPMAAVILGVAAVVSGRLADRLTRQRGLYAQASMVAVLKACALPFTITFYLATTTQVAVTAYFVAILFSTAYSQATFSLIQSEAPVRLRATWAAITLLINNMIGLGLGPVAVGAISDALKPTYGAESLRYAMFTFAAITPWAIFHYWRAGVLEKKLGGAAGGCSLAPRPKPRRRQRLRVSTRNFSSGRAAAPIKEHAERERARIHRHRPLGWHGAGPFPHVERGVLQRHQRLADDHRIDRTDRSFGSAVRQHAGITPRDPVRPVEHRIADLPRQAGQRRRTKQGAAFRNCTSSNVAITLDNLCHQSPLSFSPACCVSMIVSKLRL